MLIQERNASAHQEERENREKKKPRKMENAGGHQAFLRVFVWSGAGFSALSSGFF